jgi:membrane fusion protein (multidrug efflux system)
MTLQQGSIVNANQALFTLISNDLFWVDANYEETDLQNIRPGQPAEIKLDMYPNHVFKGVVNSISGGSGAAFSLLPPENATGNWVKITQRVPVKVVIINPDPDYPLHIGTTATVTIDTHGSK